MNETEYRNQVAIRKALGRLDSQKDCDEHRELLANAHNTAVEAANIVAKEAYIAAFNATYDETHRDTYASWPTPRSLSRPTNTRSRPPIEHRSAG